MKSEKDIASLIADLKCDDPIKCQNARRALVALKGDAVGALIAALDDKKHWSHWEAAKALGEIATPEAVLALVGVLGREEFDMRWVAAEGLIRVGRTALTPLLRALISNPESVWLREGAHHVLSDMKLNGLGPAIKPVIKAIDGPSPSIEVPLAAQKALQLLNRTSQ